MTPSVRRSVLAEVRTGFGTSGSTKLIVRLLLRICEAMAGAFWYSNGVQEVSGSLGARRYVRRLRERTFGGVFAANPAH